MKKILIIVGFVVLAIIIIILLTRNDRLRNPKEKCDCNDKPTMAYQLKDEDVSGSDVETGNGNTETDKQD